MHMLGHGAPMDSSAGLRDKNVRAKRCADVCDYLCSSGYVSTMARLFPPQKPTSKPPQVQ
jgi:hypothetical protein